MIELRTMIIDGEVSDPSEDGDGVYHDAGAAHALLCAIDETFEIYRSPIVKDALQRVKNCAASYHARLMKGETI